MSEPVVEKKSSFVSSGSFKAIVGVLLLAAIGVGVWWWMTQGRESTDDAQVDAHVIPMASRVGGTVLKVPVEDNQVVEAGTVLVEIDPRDYQVAVDKARAELADAEAAAITAQSNVPITSTTATSNVGSAQSAVEQARSGAEAAAREVDVVARASHRQLRRGFVKRKRTPTRTARDVERLRGLLAKDEVSQQQFDAAVSAADAAKAAADTVRAQITEAEAGIRMAESRQIQATAGEQQARSALQGTQTAPEQVTAMRARASSAQAHVEQAKATLAQAELNLAYTVVKAPVKGHRLEKECQPGSGRTDRPTDDGAGADRRPLDHRELQGDAAGKNAAPASVSRWMSMRPAEKTSPVTSTALPPPPARASACCLPRTPPGTSSRSCSAFR